MGSSKANISSDKYNELLVDLFIRQQQGVPAIDADVNVGYQAFFKLFQRLFRTAFNDACISKSFKIVQAGVTANNFLITGRKDDSIAANLETNPGRAYIGGVPCLIVGDVNFTDATANIHRTSTLLTATVLTDSAANWPSGSLVGRQLIPNIANGTAFTISGNTATTITITGGDMTSVAAIGSKYRVALSTPGGARTDEVWLDTYVDEIDETDDPTVINSLDVDGTPINVVSAYRMRSAQAVLVYENSSTFPAPGTTYIDADGNAHFAHKLCTMARTATAAITTGIITDNRITDLGGAAEIIAARGSKPTLTDRLDVSLRSDGFLKGGVEQSFFTHDQIGNMPDTGGSVSDHDKRYFPRDRSNSRRGVILVDSSGGPAVGPPDTTEGDYTTIAAAVAAIPTTPDRQYIIIVKSTISTASTVTVNKKCTIVGQKGNTVYTYSGAGHAFDITTDGVIIKNLDIVANSGTIGFDASVGASDLLFENVQVTSSNASFVAFKGGGVNQQRFLDCTTLLTSIGSPTRGIQLASSWGQVHIRGCNLQAQIGIDVVSSGSDLAITDTRVSVINSTGVGIQISGATALTIANCKVNTDAGTLFYATGISVADSFTSTITGNVVRGFSTDGIAITTSTSSGRFTVSANDTLAYNAATVANGIRTSTNVSEVSITGNQVNLLSGSGHGISVSEDGIAIGSNDITMNGTGDGIRVASTCSHVSVVGNTIRGTVTNAINAVAGSNRVTVVGNTSVNANVVNAGTNAVTANNNAGA